MKRRMPIFWLLAVTVASCGVAFLGRGEQSPGKDKAAIDSVARVQHQRPLIRASLFNAGTDSINVLETPDAMDEMSVLNWQSPWSRD